MRGVHDEPISTDLPHSPIAGFDLDMASYGLVKVIRRDHTDPASAYRWEPKRSIHAVARHNRARCDQRHAPSAFTNHGGS
ncbi:hypothetical protein OG427_03290 [Streptomyces sp. NBC_00133]|uniref:hypothetical protein n=1 Tax=Streptomyces sp. NBC_00133 TaxID=2903624 RepID=UPI0032516A41